MPTQHFAFRRILDTLSRHEVEYLLIGGVCAVAHGAPVTTFDVDVLYRLDESNVNRVLAALAALEAYHREPGTRRLPPDHGALARGGPCLFTTIHGALDLLGELAGGRRYEHLAPHAVTLGLSGGLRVLALDLETLIAVKRETGRPKDLAVLPILEATFRERQQPNPKPPTERRQ